MKKGIFHCLLIVLACCLLQSARAQCILGALSKDLLDPNAPEAFKSFIKGNPDGMMAYGKYLLNPELRKDVDVLTSTANFLTRRTDYLRDYPGKFEEILENLKKAGARCKTCVSGKQNKGIPMLNVIIDDMDWAWETFKDGNVDIQKLFTEMAANSPKADGGSFALNVLRANARADASYVSSIQKFEWKYLDDAKFEADVWRQVGDDHFLTEFKSFAESSWQGFSNNPDYVKQFMAYFKSEKNFEYLANVGKLSTVENPARFVKTQFMKIFDANAAKLMETRPELFIGVKFGTETINIETVEELKNLCQNADFAESSLFNFVKVK
jgi:hypothetical protein